MRHPESDKQSKVILYREWQRPWVAALLLGAIYSTGGLAAAVLGGVTGHAWFDRFDWIATGSLATLGVVYALFAVGKTIRLERDAMRVGWARIPLAAVTNTAILRGRELRRARSAIVTPNSKTSPLLLGGGFLFSARVS